ncbi:hypothetical protein Taro_000941 [Colocasia esculenta]|uniref:Uncharacterized protein n=1 Tax=Colocasia esculenta TaxID=4460 RepID=A0A843TJC1_COLES|nr:hypothetical protein [Colocasia esculenta]
MTDSLPSLSGGSSSTPVPGESSHSGAVLLPVGVTFPYWVSFLETHSPPFQVGHRRLPFQASLATPVLVRPSCSE